MGKKNRKKLGPFEIPALRNASKTLLANIRFASIDERVKTMVITSSTPDEGKTTVCSNLACAIASAGHSVLLVDADMRRRCLASMLDVHPRHGLYAVLSGEAQLGDVIVPTSYPNLYFMDSEPNIPSPPDLLSTRRFAALVDKLRETYDYVIFDTPPLEPFVDAAIISNLVDGTILAVRERKAKRDSIANTIQQLKAANARILGTVMTFTSESDNDYYYAYYNEKGERVNKEDQTPATPPSELIDDDISGWARRTGVETANREARDRRAARNAIPSVNPAPASGFGQNPNGNSYSYGYGYADQSRRPADNPYTPGAFRPAVPNAKQPRHKNNRI